MPSQILSKVHVPLCAADSHVLGTNCARDRCTAHALAELHALRLPVLWLEACMHWPSVA